MRAKVRSLLDVLYNLKNSKLELGGEECKRTCHQASNEVYLKLPEYFSTDSENPPLPHYLPYLEAAVHIECSGIIMANLYH